MRIFDAIVHREEIIRGWSGDRKFRAETAEGQAYFLRISPIEQYDRREREFARMGQAAALGIRMCEPVEFGICAEGVYTLLRWIGGRDAEQVLPELSEERQYAYGIEAGQMLRKMHTIPAPAGPESWEVRYGRKIDRKLAAYEACPLKYDDGGVLVEYLKAHRDRINGRPQTFQHGDYHCGNLMFDEAMGLTVIDFDRDDYGDPWQEFNRIIWDVRCAPRFACGLVDGYFGGSVPVEFWELLALYQSLNMLSSLPWAMDFGEEEVRTARENAKSLLDWFAGFTGTVPVWYRKPAPCGPARNVVK